MLKKWLFLLSIGLSLSSLSQYTQSLDEMSSKEIKQFLLDHPNEDVNSHMKKYKANQKLGGIMALSSVAVLVIGSASIQDNSQNNPGDDSHIFKLVPVLMGSGVILLAGITTLISSEGQFKKAKVAYENQKIGPKYDALRKLNSNEFLFDDSISAGVAEISTKYQKTKKASTAFLVVAGVALLSSLELSNPNDSQTALDIAGVTGSMWLITSIASNRQLKKAKGLHAKEVGLTAEKKPINLNIRDDAKIYHSIFQ